MSIATPLRPASPTRTTPALPPIGLADLNSIASLQARVDTKYLVGADTVEDLPSLLPPGSRILQIGELQRFAYHSVYFDTPRLGCYQASATERRKRFKVRTRAYLDSEQAFLEVKVRGSRGITEKARIPHDFDRLDQLDKKDIQFIESVLRRAQIDHTVARTLSPSIATGFQRSTYVSPGYFCPTRTTVDTGLYWEQLREDAYNEAHSMIFRPMAGIIETKSRFVSNSVNHLLWDQGIRPQPISKYCTGAALLDPRLPANRWHRSLQALVTPSEAK